MSDHEIFVMATIRGLVERKAQGTATVTLDSDLITDLALDSLEIAELSAVLEEEYGDDPYAAGVLARSPREVLAFYRGTGTGSNV